MPRPISISAGSVFDRVAAMAERRSLDGKLLLAAGFSQSAAEWLLASGIAGATSLLIENNADRLSEARHHRIVEFLVTTLPEAIRILKNQIRKRESVSVCVAGDRSMILAEMLDRGLQPDLLVPCEDEVSPDWCLPFLDRGAGIVGSGESPVGCRAVTWRVSEASGRWLPALDRVLEEVLDKGTGFPDFRVRWLRAAPGYLDPLLRFERYCRLNGEDTEAFISAVRRVVAVGGIGVSVSVQVEGSLPVLIR